MSAFSEKKIDVTFNLAQGQFEGGGNTATVTGLRVSASITNHGGAEQSMATLAIFGMPLSLMNQLTNVGTKYAVSHLNGILIYAGDADGMTLVFAGSIYNAFVSAQGMPEVFLQVIAQVGYFFKMKPVPALSIKGSSDVATMMAGLAKQMGLAFENAGVTAKLANAYYWGTAWQQAGAIAKDAGIDWIIDKTTLVITDPAKGRTGDVPLISATTGMVGYPAFNTNQVIVTALFNPAVKYMGKVEIKSDLTGANGRFIVQDLVYDLESLTPHGRWFMTITAYTAGDTPS